jgi:choline-sulfatase
MHPGATALVLAIALASCRAEPPPAKQEPMPAPAAAASPSALPSAQPIEAAAQPEPRGPFNLLLIVIDSLRADMPWNGYHRPIAPRLSELAREAVTYGRAYALSSTTARSIAPLFAGKYASEMVRTGHYFTHYYPDNLFVSERARDAGLVTIAVHTHAYFYGGGMNQGFTHYHVLPGTVHKDPEPKPTAERVTATARRLIDKAAGPDGSGRFFAYLHYIDPHAPYLEHEDRPSWGKSARDLYDQEVHYTDQHVGALIDWVKRRPFGERTAIVVTADHGEAFGEHGQHKHGYELWEELVRVPLIIRVPGADPRRIDLPRSHIDLAPTFIGLMGLPPDPALRGESLVAEIYGGETLPRPVVIDLPRDDLQDRRRALVEGDLKLIARGDDERWLLYDLAADPRERKNLTDSEPALFRRMKGRYVELSRAIPIEEVRGEVKLKNAPEGRRW